MRKPKKEIQLTSYDELLGINEAEQNTLILAGMVLLFLLSCCFMVARLLDEEISMYGYEAKKNWEREQLPDKLSRSSTDERHGDK